MKILVLTRSLLFLTALLLFATARSQNSMAVQNVAFAIRPITTMSISRSYVSLVIAPARGSSFRESIRDNSTQYRLLTNIDNLKISASIDKPMPRGSSLLIRLRSSNGMSQGAVDISRAMTSSEVVGGIGRGSDGAEPVEYTLIVGSESSDLRGNVRSVIFTLTN